jgi:hypothetical protein
MGLPRWLERDSKGAALFLKRLFKNFHITK